MLRFLRFLAFPRQVRILLLQAGVLVPAVRLGLWALPYRWVFGWLRQPQPRRRRRSANPPTVAQIARSVRVVSKRVPRATCLTQAIAAQRLLAWYGYDPIVKVGAALDGEALHAHAWVEVNGQPVIGGGPSLARYSEFSDLQDALS